MKQMGWKDEEIVQYLKKRRGIEGHLEYERVHSVVRESPLSLAVEQVEEFTKQS
jgi:hypothetical protein